MWLFGMSLNDTTPAKVSLLASSLFQPQDHQKGNTIEVLVAICKACQSWKPLFDSWTTHSHWEHFDFLARLLGSPGLSPAPWCHEWPALSSTSRGAECTDSPEGSEWSQRSLSAGGSTVERECWCLGERETGGTMLACVCVCVCVSGMSVGDSWSDLYSVWQAVMGWLTTIKHIQYTHLVPDAVMNWIF